MNLEWPTDVTGYHLGSESVYMLPLIPNKKSIKIIDFLGED